MKDNEGHDPNSLMNTPSHTVIGRLDAQIKRSQTQREEEFRRSADKTETVDVDRAAVIINLIRENNRREAEIDALRANAEDLRQNCTRVVAENGRLKAALKDIAATDLGTIPPGGDPIETAMFRACISIARGALEQPALQVHPDTGGVYGTHDEMAPMEKRKRSTEQSTEQEK